MRYLILLFLVLASALHADELETAYQKEYAYLVAEKQALQQRLANLKKIHAANLSSITTEIDAQQSDYLTRQNRIDRLNQQIVEASRGVDHVENDSLLLQTTLLQARDSLGKAGHVVNENQAQADQLESALSIANDIIVNDGAVKKDQGQFFSATGEAVEGDIIHIGRIARYGLSDETGGALAPSGNGHFRVWDSMTMSTAQQVMQGNPGNSIDLFLYDNVDKAIDKKEDRGWQDDVEAGKVIGKVIVALGLSGILLVLLRVLFLWLFSADISKITRKVSDKISQGQVDDALKSIKKNTSSASKVISSTLKHLDKDRDHIEDIISESILHESTRIDRFGTAILVIAAIAPLLGLLGTVTGMISTFDIITEFGTGDPKLLSSGISEALITTKFGLIVAIPMLLVGNILSAWGSRIKNELEQAALHIINTHKA